MVIVLCGRHPHHLLMLFYQHLWSLCYVILFVHTVLFLVVCVSHSVKLGVIYHCIQEEVSPPVTTSGHRACLYIKIVGAEVIQIRTSVMLEHYDLG